MSTAQALPIERVIALVEDDLKHDLPGHATVSKEGLRTLHIILQELRERGVKEFLFDPSRSTVAQAYQLKLLAQELDLLMDQGMAPEKAELKMHGTTRDNQKWAALENELKHLSYEGHSYVPVESIKTMEELELAVVAAREQKLLKENAEKKLDAERSARMTVDMKPSDGSMADGAGDVKDTLKTVLYFGVLFAAAETLKNVLNPDRLRKFFSPEPKPAKTRDLVSELEAEGAKPVKAEALPQPSFDMKKGKTADALKYEPFKPNFTVLAVGGGSTRDEMTPAPAPDRPPYERMDRLPSRFTKTNHLTLDSAGDSGEAGDSTG